jgi:hypothetical protein
MLRARILRSLSSFLLLDAALASVAAPARAQMSEAEKKSAARAAFAEGVQLQDAGKAAEALSRFQAAQKLIDAPTHQLHIAECLALTGKLLESAETYEALTRRNLGASPPEAFKQAQDQGKAELPAVRARIPNLRVTVKPEPKTLRSLQVTVNGVVMPNELLGIARPVNPGHYKIDAAAIGYKAAAPQELTLGERNAKTDPIDVALVLQPAPSQTVVVAPPPPPYTGVGNPPPTGEPPPPPPPVTEQPKPKHEGSSSTGILVGARGGVLIPGAGVSANRSFDTVATTGFSVGADLMARFARLLLVGGTLEYGALSGPSDLQKLLGAGVSGETSQHTFYVGVNFGILPNVDKVSFIGDVGLGLRTLSRTVTLSQLGFSADETLSGVEGEIGAGVSVPAGKRIRIVPKAMLNIGSFQNATSDCASTVGGRGFDAGSCLSDGEITDTATHTFFWVGLALYYNADLGRK